jgi:uncharacterized membrane protein
MTCLTVVYILHDMPDSSLYITRHADSSLSHDMLTVVYTSHDVLTVVYISHDVLTVVYISHDVLHSSLYIT